MIPYALPPGPSKLIAQQLLDILGHDDVGRLRELVETHPALFTQPLSIAIVLFCNVRPLGSTYTAEIDEEAFLNQCNAAGRVARDCVNDRGPDDQNGRATQKTGGARQPKTHDNRHTALALSIWLHATQCFTFLLPKSDPNQCTSSPLNALLFAAKCEFGFAIDPLLSLCDPTQQHPGGYALLHILASGNSVEPTVFERAMRLVDLDARDSTGSTALMCAASAGQERWVRLLLPYSHLDAQPHFGCEAFFCALSHPRVFALFVEHHDNASTEAVARERLLLTLLEKALSTAQLRESDSVCLTTKRLDGRPFAYSLPSELARPSLSLLRSREERRVLQRDLLGTAASPTPPARSSGSLGETSHSSSAPVGRRRI